MSEMGSSLPPGSSDACGAGSDPGHSIAAQGRALVAADQHRHGTIRLIEPACTSCMICARECPSWCITIDSHTEPIEGLPPGTRERTRNVLDRFAIDWSLCMYCGICVDECPFDALEWDPAPTAAGASRDAVHEEMA